MAEPIPITFGTQSDPGRFSADTGPRHFNASIGIVAEGKLPQEAPIYACAGFTLLGTVSGVTGFRGGLAVGGFVYALVGTQVVQVDSGGNITVLGGIPGTARAIFAQNQKEPNPQIVVVTGGQRYVIEAGTVSPIEDEDLPAANSVCFLNQRILFLSNKGRLTYSAVSEATDISALAFVEAEGSPDGGVRVIEHLQEAIVFGTETTQVFRDTGAGTNPIRPNAGVVIPKGCIGTHAVAKLDTDLFFIGHDLQVYRLVGASFEPVGHYGVHRSLRGTTNLTQVECDAHYEHGMGILTVTGPDWTWQYNRNLKKWYERRSYGLTRWRVRGAVQFGTRTLLGDYENGKLYLLSEDAYDENGAALVWTVRSPILHAYPNMVSCDRLHLDFEVGVGLNSTDAYKATPQVMLRWSDDCGKSWSNELRRSLGTINQPRFRVTFDGLGTTSEMGRIWEVSVSSPVIRTLLQARLEGDVALA